MKVLHTEAIISRMPVAVFNRLLRMAEPYDVICQCIVQPKQLQRETAQEFSFDSCAFSLIFTYYLFVFFFTYNRSSF